MYSICLLYTSTYVELDAYDSDGTAVTSYRYDNGGSGIKPGSVYTFQVSALNEEAGEGSRSSTLQVYVQASDAPAIVEATVSGYTTLNLTWTPPQTIDEVEGYYLQLNGLDGLSLIHISFEAGCSLRSDQPALLQHC